MGFPFVNAKFCYAQMDGITLAKCVFGLSELHRIAHVGSPHELCLYAVKGSIQDTYDSANEGLVRTHNSSLSQKLMEF